jgi:hypothetical protein
MALLDIFSKTDLGPAATALVHRVANAIGAVAGPPLKVWQVMGDVEAEKKRVLGRIEISDAEQEALSSFSRQWRREKERQIAVLGQTIGLLQPSADPDAIDEDWLLFHLDKIRLVSDQEMQSLWAKILAQEANRSGLFTKGCLNFLSTLEKEDADLFTSLCRFIVHSEVGPICAVLVETATFPSVYRDNRIESETLAHLQELGLIRFNSEILSDGMRSYETPKVRLRYFQEQRTFRVSEATWPVASMNPSKYWIHFGVAGLTEIGKQLSRIAGAKPIPGFFDYLESEWAKKGVFRESTSEQV